MDLLPLLTDITPPHGSDPSPWIQALSLWICSFLPQIPSRGRCAGWRPAPPRAKGTSRYSTRDSGGTCATPEPCSESSAAGRSAGSWAAGISPPAWESGSLPRRESPAALAPCTSASPSLGTPGAAPGPELCVSHGIRGLEFPRLWNGQAWAGPNPRGIWAPGGVMDAHTVAQSSGDIRALPRPGLKAASRWSICWDRGEHLPGPAAFPGPCPDLWPSCLSEADEEK